MYKRATALAFLFASLVTSVQASEENGWYMGTKMGWSRLNLLKKEDTPKPLENNTTKEKLSAPIFGLFLGYDFNPNLGIEVSNDTTGFSPYLMFKKSKDPVQFNNIQISTKISYPASQDFHFYTQLGGLAFWEDLKSKDDIKNIFTKDSMIIPSFSLGAEYISNKKFITRLDYTWKNSIKNISNASMQPHTGDIALSFGWKFGDSDVNDTLSSYSSELEEDPYVSLNESVNFPFNSTEIQPSEYESLEKLDNKIKGMNLKHVSIVLSGHTDRIGEDNYNQNLSEERAHNIKNYFISKGFEKETITVQGFGDAYPITDDTCKDIENSSLLVSCLAPDRRVDIEILSVE